MGSEPMTEAEARDNGDPSVCFQSPPPSEWRRAADTIERLESESTALRSRLADVVKIAEEAIGHFRTCYAAGLFDKGTGGNTAPGDVDGPAERLRARLSALTPGGDRGT
jgi:hypothetical protein